MNNDLSFTDPDNSFSLRGYIEQREQSLSPWATRARDSKGRMKPEEPCPLRTVFQRDRDRIIHTNAFRRLKHKTQVFIAPMGDHYVTRLTHTLEVAQVARTIARALNLNEDLVEAICMGHDLGHSPFGHAGEKVLAELYYKGFAHSAQSLRIVDLLEKDGQGLNLTREVRQGIAAHSKPRGDFLKGGLSKALTLEAQVCRVADAMAYLNHDIVDALRAKVLVEEDLPPEVICHLGTRHSERINTIVMDIVESSWLASGRITTSPGDVPSITMSSRMRELTTLLREFLFDRVYLPASSSPAGRKAQEVVRFLYQHFCSHPQDVPSVYWRRSEDVERVVVDYLSGMTDHFALRTVEEIQPGITQGIFRQIL